MNDLISRQAAIDALAKNMPSLTTPDGCGQFDHDIYVTDEAYVDCMQIIHDMQSAQPEQRWIPVSERLPEAGKYVLRTIRKFGWQGEEYWSVDIGPYNTNDGSIIAWMPLPEPYKGGE